MVTGFVFTFSPFSLPPAGSTPPQQMGGSIIAFQTSLLVFIQFILSVQIGDTVCTGKGAQGTWCVTHSKWCTRVAMTCDEVDKVHKGGVKRPKIYYI